MGSVISKGRSAEEAIIKNNILLPNKLDADKLIKASDKVLYMGLEKMQEIIIRDAEPETRSDGIVYINPNWETKVKAMNAVVNLGKYLTTRKRIEREMEVEDERLIIDDIDLVMGGDGDVEDDEDDVNDDYDLIESTLYEGGKEYI